jgi:hypothetical protein
MRSRRLAVLLAGLLLLSFVAGTATSFAKETGGHEFAYTERLEKPKRVGLGITGGILGVIGLAGIGWLVFAKRGPVRE